MFVSWTSSAGNARGRSVIVTLLVGGLVAMPSLSQIAPTAHAQFEDTVEDNAQEAVDQAVRMTELEYEIEYWAENWLLIGGAGAVVGGVLAVGGVALLGAPTAVILGGLGIGYALGQQYSEYRQLKAERELSYLRESKIGESEIEDARRKVAEHERRQAEEDRKYEKPKKEAAACKKSGGEMVSACSGIKGCWGPECFTTKCVKSGSKDAERGSTYKWAGECMPKGAGR